MGAKGTAAGGDGTDDGLRVLAVASGGGHLAELYELAPRMVGRGARIDWITSDRPQGRSLLRDERAHFVRAVEPREAGSVAANLPHAVRVLRGRRYGAVLGSGALALSYLPLARALGMPAHWVECATRTDGPSVTGRLLAALPGVRTYTQHRAWEGPSWTYRGSVFDAYEPEARPDPPALRRIVVTVGMNPYPFRRLFERLVEVVPRDAEVLWQAGVTDTSGLGVDACSEIPSRQLAEACERADVVVAHAGTGSSLAALDAGRIPVLVARLAAHGEQVDDHQQLLVDDLVSRGLAVGATVEELDLAVLRQAAAGGVRRRAELARFALA